MNQSSNHDHLVIHEKVTNGYHRDFTYTELWLFESVIIFLRSCLYEILNYFSQMKNLKVNFQRCKGKPRPWLHQYSLPRHATNNSPRRSILEIHKDLFFLFHFSRIQQQSCFIYTSSELLAILITAPHEWDDRLDLPDKFPDFPQLWVYYSGWW